MAATTGIHRFIIFMLLIFAVADAAYLEMKSFDLDVDTLTAETYAKFLNDLRKRLASTYSKNVPVLPVFDPKNNHAFNIVLKATKDKVTHTTTARFRGDDLYFLGFQMETGNKPWCELLPKKKEDPKEKDPPHLIQGARFLDFDGGYPTLEGIAGQVTDLQINKKELANSVAVLAGSTDKGARARASLVVIQMISEAARFLDVSGHFASNLVSGTKLPGWMRTDLENNWARFSYEVLKPEADPCYKFHPPTIKKKIINSADALRGYFGILHRDKDTLNPPSTPPCKILHDDASGFGPVMVAQA